MTLTYEDIHGGLAPPNGTEPIRVLVGDKARAEGQMISLSYAGDKGKGPEVYQHPFKKRKGRFPYLFRQDDKGAFRPADNVPELTGIAPLVDVVLKDGRRGIGSDCLVATDGTGSSLWLVSFANCPFAFEQRGRLGPRVERRGIVG